LQPVELPEHRKGLIVLTVEADGPAHQAGMLIGDVLVSLGGQAVAETDDVQSVLESYRVAQSIDAGVLRGGVQNSFSIVIGERPRRS
jgi:S1-C subfamily serine protease